MHTLKCVQVLSIQVMSFLFWPEPQHKLHIEEQNSVLYVAHEMKPRAKTVLRALTAAHKAYCCWHCNNLKQPQVEYQSVLYCTHRCVSFVLS